MFGNSWRLGRIAGVEIRIDTSWVIIALLITYSLFIQFTLTFERLAAPPAIVLAVVTAALFFGSVLAHEMAHAVVARSRGIPVRGITLFLFGGATHAKVESRGPRDEFVISVVGPITSLALGGVFILLGRVLDGVIPDPAAGGLRYLGFVNVLLAVFNLLPGFPLDGGRVLRSAVWKATGSLPRATRVASISGQAMGYLLIATGAFMVFMGTLGGLWLAAIGWFLAQAARASYQELQVRGWLESVEADEVMAGDLMAIPDDLTLQEAVDRFFMRYDHGAFPVEAGGKTVGLITLRGIKRVPREDRDTTRVRDVMGEIGDQTTVKPETRMDHVLSKLQDGDANRVLVVSDDEVVGIITPSDVARWLQRRRALEV